MVRSALLTPHSFSVTLFTLGFRLFFIQLQINQPEMNGTGLVADRGMLHAGSATVGCTNVVYLLKKDFTL
jgi:hypothetical protein